MPSLHNIGEVRTDDGSRYRVDITFYNAAGEAIEVDDAMFHKHCLFSLGSENHKTLSNYLLTVAQSHANTEKRSLSDYNVIEISNSGVSFDRGKLADHSTVELDKKELSKLEAVGETATSVHEVWHKTSNLLISDYNNHITCKGAVDHSYPPAMSAAATLSRVHPHHKGATPPTTPTPSAPSMTPFGSTTPPTARAHTPSKTTSALGKETTTATGSLNTDPTAGTTTHRQTHGRTAPPTARPDESAHSKEQDDDLVDSSSTVSTADIERSTGYLARFKSYMGYSDIDESQRLFFLMGTDEDKIRVEKLVDCLGSVDGIILDDVTFIENGPAKRLNSNKLADFEKLFRNKDDTSSSAAKLFAGLEGIIEKSFSHELVRGDVKKLANRYLAIRGRLQKLIAEKTPIESYNESILNTFDTVFMAFVYNKTFDKQETFSKQNTQRALRKLSDLKKILQSGSESFRLLNGNTLVSNPFFDESRTSDSAYRFYVGNHRSGFTQVVIGSCFEKQVKDSSRIQTKHRCEEIGICKHIFRRDIKEDEFTIDQSLTDVLKG